MAEILLGVTGSIAAYRACDLASSLKKRGHQVTAILTRAGSKLVAREALRTLTGRTVIDSLFPEVLPDACPHIALTDRASLFMVAPATANFLAKAALGLADDALTTMFLAACCPVLIAPAMNHRMWRNPIVQEHVHSLRERGFQFVGPEAGMLACGWEGEGRLAPVSEILEVAGGILAAQPTRPSLPALEVPVVCEQEPPAYQTELSAGMDLVATASVILEPGETAAISTGVKVAIPAGYEGQVRPRSGLVLNHGVTCLNSPGTIDADYRGEIRVILHNAGHRAYTVEPGQRVAQLVVARCERVAWRKVRALDATDRGEGGFGHTG